MTRVKFTLQLAALIALMPAAVCSAYFAITGMALMFPGNTIVIIWIAVSLEAAKLATAAWLSHRWVEVIWPLRLILVAYTVSIILIDAASLHSQLVVGVRHRDGADPFGLWASGEMMIRLLIAWIAWMGAFSGPLAIILAAGLSAVRCRAA